MPTGPRYKTCSQCGERRPLAEFYKNSRSTDRHTAACKLCTNNRTKLTYEGNREAVKARTRKYHLDHPEWSKERLRAHHEKHRDERYQRYLERGKDPVIKTNRRESTRRAEQRRRAIKAQAAVADLITVEDLAELLLEFESNCYICEDPLPEDFHWDHYQPLAAGGNHTVSNLRPACPPCNIRKNAVWPFTVERRQQIKQEVLALKKALQVVDG